MFQNFLNNHCFPNNYGLSILNWRKGMRDQGFDFKIVKNLSMTFIMITWSIQWLAKCLRQTTLTTFYNRKNFANAWKCHQQRKLNITETFYCQKICDSFLILYKTKWNFYAHKTKESQFHCQKSNQLKNITTF